MTFREDIHSNSRMFLMCVLVPLSLALGCVVVVAREDIVDAADELGA